MCVRAIQLVSDRLCLTDPEWQSKELVGEAEMWKKAGILRATKRYTTVDCDCDEQLHQADVRNLNGMARRNIWRSAP